MYIINITKWNVGSDQLVLKPFAVSISFPLPIRRSAWQLQCSAVQLGLRCSLLSPLTGLEFVATGAWRHGKQMLGPN